MAYSIHSLLDLVVRQNASDLHLVVHREPTLRLHGSLFIAGKNQLTREDTDAMAKELCDEAKYKSLNETGGAEFSYDLSGKARFRVSIYKERGNISLAIRLIPYKIKSLEEIGFPPMIVRLLEKPRGLILVTGPTGCGKTTTLAAMIDYINTNFDHHILTVEDPIEYVHEHKKSIVCQRQIGEDVSSFAEAIVKGLRQDPDVMMVGEMRNLETISAAITAAETGHLVFGTLHTIGASTTISRIIDAFPTDQQEQIRIQLSVSLVAVITQTLIPNRDATNRHAAFEILIGNSAVSNLIRENKAFRMDSVIETGRAAGMMLLDDSIYTLWEKGLISEDTALSKARDAEGMRKRLFGVPSPRK
ncbi:MAG: type IV pilus twitching motility protein PilT [Candidatus Brocadiia bacterium]